MGEDGAALPGEADGPWAQRKRIYSCPLRKADWRLLAALIIMALSVGAAYIATTVLLGEADVARALLNRRV